MKWEPQGAEVMIDPFAKWLDITRGLYRNLTVNEMSSEKGMPSKLNSEFEQQLRESNILTYFDISNDDIQPARLFCICLRHHKEHCVMHQYRVKEL